MVNKKKILQKTNLNFVKKIFLSSLLIVTSCSSDEVIVHENASLNLAAKSSKSVQLFYNSITASAEQSANPIENIDDNSMTSRWSGQGRSTNVDMDFGTETSIDYINIAFHKGDERKAYFSYWESDNGSSWSEVGSKTSSGDTQSHEEFDLTNFNARYFRIVFEGNENSDWNSVLDLEVYGTPGNGNSDSSYTSVPAQIEAEDYDTQSGTQTETTSDSGGGQNVGYIDSGDSMSYNVNVPSSGIYTIDFRVASRNVGVNFDIYQGTSKIGDIASSTANGWQSWYTVSTDVNLSSGDQTIRIVATEGGWNFNWFEVKESNNDDDGGNLDSNYPGELIGLTTNNWKLNGFTGSGSGADYEDDLLDALGLNYSNYSNDTYFYAENGFAYFKCYRGLGGSSNSSNPRVELRELHNGDDSYVWDGDEGKHTMDWTVRVDQLPEDTDGKGGVLCFGQIHGPSDSQGFNDDGVDVDDTIRVQFIGDENQSSGSVKLKISGYITEEQGGSVTLDTDYYLDTEYDFRITMEEGYISVHIDGSEVFGRQLDTSGDTSYFKVGNYLQSVKGASYTGSYGLVGIKNLSVSHPNSSENK